MVYDVGWQLGPEGLRNFQGYCVTLLVRCYGVAHLAALRQRELIATLVLSRLLSYVAVAFLAQRRGREVDFSHGRTLYIHERFVAVTAALLVDSGLIHLTGTEARDL